MYNDLYHFSSSSYSVPLVPQDVRAISNGTTSLVVTWKAPAVVLRECAHDEFSMQWL